VPAPGSAGRSRTGIRARSLGDRGREDGAGDLFSFRWHPYAIEPGVDYSKEPMTLIEFRLEEVRGRHTSHRGRIRVRPDPSRAPSEGIRDERSGLGGSDEIDQASISAGRHDRGVESEASQGPDPCLRGTRRTRRAWRSCRDSAPGAILDRAADGGISRQPSSGHQALARACACWPGSERSQGPGNPVEAGAPTGYPMRAATWTNLPSTGTLCSTAEEGRREQSREINSATIERSRPR